MKLINDTEKNLYLGTNFLDWFADKEFPTKTTPLFSKSLERFMINDDVLSELKPTEVELGEIYNLLDSLDTTKKHLFYVKDKDETMRPVCLVRYDNQWRLVSPKPGIEVNGWRTGTLLYSHNEIT